MQFADFNHFIAFGQFVSIDLRVKVRDMTSGRLVKTFSVNTKMAEYTVITDRVFNHREVLVQLLAMLTDLRDMAQREGFIALAEYLDNLPYVSENHTGNGNSESARESLMRLVGRLFVDNHEVSACVWK